MQNESYKHESIEQMRAQFNRQAERQNTHDEHIRCEQSSRNYHQHTQMSSPLQKNNIIGILGFVAGILAFVFLDNIFTTLLFWLLGLVASIIGAFTPRRVWGILGLMLAAIFPFIFLISCFIAWFSSDEFTAEEFIALTQNKTNEVAEPLEQQMFNLAFLAGEKLEDAMKDSSADMTYSAITDMQQESESEAISSTAQSGGKQVDYIEIKGPKGYVNVYIGMPKEEAKTLLGRADNVSVTTVGDDTHETWRYYDSSSLMIKFVNGKLKSIY